MPVFNHISNYRSSCSLFVLTSVLRAFTKGFSGVYDSIASNTEGIDKLKETVKPIMTFDLNERIYCIPASKDLVWRQQAMSEYWILKE